MIQIDARRCGAGKTHGTDGIIQTIQRYYELGQYCLVVLPSIKIIQQYERELDFIDPVDIQYVDSNRCDNTVQALTEHMGDRVQIIVTTHKSFTMALWLSGHKRDYNLIIDEEISELVCEEKLWENKTTAFTLFDNTITHLLPLEDCNVFAPKWRIMEVSKRVLDNNYTQHPSSVLQKVTDDNYKNWIIESDYTERLEGPKSGSTSVVRELDAQILRDWMTVRIACANFGSTFMRYWMDKNNLKWSILPGCEFHKHQLPITVHIPDCDDSWSITKQRNGHWLKAVYSKYAVDQNITDPVLVLRNKIDTSRIFRNEIPLPFNAHGLNDYTSYNKVSLEAAINLTPVMTGWCKEHLDMDSQQITIARTGHTFYQVLMRSSLRVGNSADIYSIDNRLATEVIGEFFDLNWRKDVLYIDTSAHKRKPLTPAEKQRAYRQRLKQQKMEDQ